MQLLTQPFVVACTHTPYTCCS